MSILIVLLVTISKLAQIISGNCSFDNTEAFIGHKRFSFTISVPGCSVVYLVGSEISGRNFSYVGVNVAEKSTCKNYRPLLYEQNQALMVGIPWRKFYHSKCQWTNIQNLYHVCQFSTSTWSNSILPQAYVKDFVVDVNNATMHIIHETEDGTMADELFDLIGWKSINKLVIGDDSLQNFAFDSDLQQLYYKTRGGMGYRSIIIGDGNSITLSEFKTLPKFAHSFVRAASFSNNFYVIKQETEDGKFEFSIGHSNKNTTMCLLKTKDNIDIQLLVGENENSTYSIVREQISPQFQTTVRPTEEVPKKASSTVFVSLTSMLLVLIISYHM